MSNNCNWMGLPLHRQDKGVGKERGETHQGTNVSTVVQWAIMPSQSNVEAGKEKSGTNFFNMDDEADQLEADMEGMLLEKGTDFFNVVAGVGFLSIRHSRD